MDRGTVCGFRVSFLEAGYELIEGVGGPEEFA